MSVTPVTSDYRGYKIGVHRTELFLDGGETWAAHVNGNLIGTAGSSEAAWRRAVDWVNLHAQ